MQEAIVVVACHNIDSGSHIFIEQQCLQKMNNLVYALTLASQERTEEARETNVCTSSGKPDTIVASAPDKQGCKVPCRNSKEKDLVSPQAAAAITPLRQGMSKSNDCGMCDERRNGLEEVKRKLEESGKLIKALRSTILTRESPEKRNRFLDHLLALLEEHETVSDQRELHFIMQLVVKRIRIKRRER